MARKIIDFDEALYAYLVDHNGPEHPVMEACRRETSAMPESGMQIAPEQAGFLRFCIAVTSARRAVEIGTFTGYSSLAISLAMGPEGRLFALDASEEWTAKARGYWQQAGVSDRIDLRLGPAPQTLPALAAELGSWGEGALDFAFVDADKTGYDFYYEHLLPMLRPGGIIVFDNALWAGQVSDPTADDADTLALRALNAKVRDDERTESALVNIGDGLLLATRRAATKPV